MAHGLSHGLLLQFDSVNALIDCLYCTVWARLNLSRGYVAHSTFPHKTKTACTRKACQHIRSFWYPPCETSAGPGLIMNKNKRQGRRIDFNLFRPLLHFSHLFSNSFQRGEVGVESKLRWWADENKLQYSPLHLPCHSHSIHPHLSLSAQAIASLPHSPANIFSFSS